MKQNSHCLFFGSPRTGMSIPDLSHLSEAEKENLTNAIVSNCNVRIVFKSADITSLVKKEGSND